MRTGLPEAHGIPEQIVASALIHRDSAGVQLTNVQYQALEQGVARGKSLLVVAPTSSGKTDVGLFAAASWLATGLADGARVVFLTSHRALARQKFTELQERFAPLFSLTPSELVLATGDDVINAEGDLAPDAFSAPVLIATYEKYLNMLAGAGMQSGADKLCCIADEIQLIGDEARGQNVEILLTLMRARVGQIVGLSAVLERQYARLLADWLEADLVLTGEREIPLIYELRTPGATFITNTKAERQPERAIPRPVGTIATLRELLVRPSDQEPIAVFCMTKRQVFELAEEWAQQAARLGARVDDGLPLFRERTASSEELSRYLPHRFAYHTADLNEDERIAVETRLDGNELRVVFATTTLAAGLNYSFRTVIIHAWRRWQSVNRTWVPIPRGEFHNMAGRAGRLARVDTAGHVIFFASDTQELRAAPRYLSWWELDNLAPQIRPSSFSQLSLQLLAAGIANSEQQLSEFLQSTFSAQRELERNAKQPELWRDAINKSVVELKGWRFVA